MLSLILALVAAGTTAAGAALGGYASRRVLRPLTVVADAARHISDGDLTARLDTATGPELERLTDSFNTMVDQLARRLERDRRFAADVSHELRSPLQTLAAAAAVLERRRDQLDQRTGSAVDLITAEISRFEDLVSDLLELARSDQPAELAPVDMAAPRPSGLPEHAAYPRASCSRRPGRIPPWLVDRRRFEQILANLLDNAHRHGGGAVAVRVATSDGQHTLDVDDEGPGVAPEDRSVIFDRFVRGRGANARGARRRHGTRARAGRAARRQSRRPGVRHRPARRRRPVHRHRFLAVRPPPHPADEATARSAITRARTAIWSPSSPDEDL